MGLLGGLKIRSMPKNKPQNPQPQTPTIIQERDKFETPNWATDIIILTDKMVEFSRSNATIWEPCSGTGRMVRRLSAYVTVVDTDLEKSPNWDVLTFVPEFHWDAAVTNPPFSIWYKVWRRLLEFEKPVALLVPDALTGRMQKAIYHDGGQLITPSKRISFITPNMCELVHKKTGKLFSKVDDIPNALIQKCSSAQMETAWLTWRWNLPDQLNEYVVKSGVLEYV